MGVSNEWQDYLYLIFLYMFQEATSLDDLYENEDAASHHSVHWELEEVLGICKKLQKSTLVSSFDQILFRSIQFISGLHSSSM